LTSTRKNCLWRGREFRAKGYNLAAWSLIRRPKAKGGLGVINLSLQNDALLLKQLDKFYRKADIQWVSLMWQRYYVDSIPHLTREKGSFWWRDISGLIPFTEVLLLVILIREIPLAFGKMSLMVP
jgi:hypothetical protein